MSTVPMVGGIRVVLDRPIPEMTITTCPAQPNFAPVDASKVCQVCPHFRGLLQVKEDGSTTTVNGQKISVPFDQCFRVLCGCPQSRSLQTISGIQV